MDIQSNLRPHPAHASTDRYTQPQHPLFRTFFFHESCQLNDGRVLLEWESGLYGLEGWAKMRK